MWYFFNITPTFLEQIRDQVNKNYTVLWKSIFPLYDLFMFCRCHTYMSQFIKQILIPGKNKPNKYKMQFLNEDFVYYGKKAIQTYLPCVEKIIAP